MLYSKNTPCSIDKNTLSPSGTTQLSGNLPTPCLLVVVFWHPGRHHPRRPPCPDGTTRDNRFRHRTAPNARRTNSASRSGAVTRRVAARSAGRWPPAQFQHSAGRFQDVHGWLRKRPAWLPRRMDGAGRCPSLGRLRQLTDADRRPSYAYLNADNAESAVLDIETRGGDMRTAPRA